MSNNLWVGSLSGDVTESDLRNLFEKHGDVDNVTCYPSRNYAFIKLKNVDDAKRAKDNLQGVVLRGNPMKIDFAKPAKPCKSLWVSGISTSFSKEDLENEFSKFGKIEDFKFQWDKNVAIIDYFRLEDAIKALKAMHGKYIGDTMLRVDYSRSQSRKHTLLSEDRKADEKQPTNILCISYPPAVQIDEQMLHNAMILFGEIEMIKSFPSRYCSFVEFRSTEEAERAMNGLQGKLFYDPRILITFSENVPRTNQYLTGTRSQRPDASGQPIAPNNFNEHVVPRAFAPPGNASRINPVDGYNWMSSASASLSPLTKSTPGTWDGFDASQNQRQPKRLRTDSVMNDQGLLTNQTSRGVPLLKSLVPANVDHPGTNCIWRGVIAKGGTPVCRARCIPVGDWIGYEMPEIVNCSARTGLDTLAKHYSESVGFDIVFFLPDNEEDFASYTEFLRYMGDRNRAGVVKFVDGTTLFLVPPSDFLRTVLKVYGPERLYGVVLKFAQHASDSLLPGPSISQSQFIDQFQRPVISNHEHVNSLPPISATPTNVAGLSLTPELVASLASLTNVKSNGQQSSGITVSGPLSHETQFQGRIYEPASHVSVGSIYEPASHVSMGSIYEPASHVSMGSIYEPASHMSMGSMTNSSVQTSQAVQFAPSMQATQQYQFNFRQDLHTAGNVTSSNHKHDHVFEPQSMAQDQQKLEFDVDKNERYQSTLQFAANLLLQIHQKQSGTKTDGNQ